MGAEQGHLSTVAALIGAGADIDGRGEENNTALIAVAFANNTKVRAKYNIPLIETTSIVTVTIGKKTL